MTSTTVPFPDAHGIADTNTLLLACAIHDKVLTLGLTFSFQNAVTTVNDLVRMDALLPLVLWVGAKSIQLLFDNEMPLSWSSRAVGDGALTPCTVRVSSSADISWIDRWATSVSVALQKLYRDQQEAATLHNRYRNPSLALDEVFDRFVQDVLPGLEPLEGSNVIFMKKTNHFVRSETRPSASTFEDAPSTGAFLDIEETMRIFNDIDGRIDPSEMENYLDRLEQRAQNAYDEDQHPWFEMQHNLNTVEMVILNVVDRPLFSVHDLKVLLADFAARTATWENTWFGLAWNGVVRFLPLSSDQSHRFSPRQNALVGQIDEQDWCEGPIAQMWGVWLPEVFGASWSHRSDMLLMGLQSPNHPLSLRLSGAPLIDHVLDNERLDRDQQASTTPSLPLMKVIQEPVREFRNSKAYDVLRTGIPVRAVTSDVQAWQTTMDGEFPWMRTLTARLVRRLTIQEANALPLRLPNIALLGAPGVGKTLYWRSAMRHLNHPLVVLPMAGSNDSMTIKGTAAGWSTERPGIAVHVMMTEKCANPVILLDEIDKAGGDMRNGNASEALLGLLESSTSQALRDDCLQQDVNASLISWVLTLNDEDLLSDALRSRVEVLHVSGPDWSNPEHVKAALIMGEALAWEEWSPALQTLTTRLSDAQKRRLIATRWTSLRSLGKAIAALLEENLYEATVVAKLKPSAMLNGNTKSMPSWRPDPGPTSLE